MAGLHLDLLGELTALPRPPSWILGVGVGTRELGTGIQKGQQVQGREGTRNGWDGTGEEGGNGGKGKGRENLAPR